MKQLILLLFPLLMFSQDKRFTLSAHFEVPDKNTHTDKLDFGFNMGLELDYQRTVMYNNAEIYYFPDLNGLDYFHVEGTLLGFNWFDMDDYWRYYLGLLKGGFILRPRTFGPMVGSDIGIEHYFSDFFMGLETGWDYKMDDKAWDVNGTGHGVWYVAFKIGKTL